MTTDNFCFHLQNGLIQTSETGGQWYSDTSPFSIPWCGYCLKPEGSNFKLIAFFDKEYFAIKIDLLNSLIVKIKAFLRLSYKHPYYTF
jgi:hypothetical protein